MCWNLFCVKRRLKKVPRGEVGTLNGTADTSHQVILFQRKALLRGNLGQFRNRCCMCLVGRWFITVPACLGFRFFTNDSIMNWTTRILRHYFWDSTSALELFCGGVCLSTRAPSCVFRCSSVSGCLNTVTSVHVRATEKRMLSLGRSPPT